MATLVLRFHGGARELVGASETSLELDSPCDEAALRRAILTQHPALDGYLARMRLAQNDAFVLGDATFSHGDIVDVMPPVAGGSGPLDSSSEKVTLCAIRDTPLSMDEVMHAVADPTAGGIAYFAGVVRNHHGGKRVDRLEYEAHPTLAQKEMARVLAGVAGEFACTKIAGVHREGTLAVGDLAVLVAASSPHRAEAFDACRAAIDRIKETVPIWKKEWATDGTPEWIRLEKDG